MIAKDRVLAAARLLRGPAIVLVVYLILRAIFGALADREGLISPGGSVNIGVALIGALVIALRLVAIFILPGAIAYRITAHFIKQRR